MDSCIYKVRKVSQFAVASPLFADIDGIQRYAIFQTSTGEMALVSRELWESLQNGAADRVTAEEVKRLAEQGILVNAEIDEVSSILSQNATAQADPAALKIVIQPSDICQAGCGYCGQTHGNSRMTPELLEKISTRIKHKLEQAQRKSLVVVWFGAEPLSAVRSMRQLSPRLISLCEQHATVYSARVITNGILLSAPLFDELRNVHRVNEIEVTLDGTAEYHNKRRMTKIGTPTFHIIWKNLEAILSQRKNSGVISIRCNVDRHNLEGVVPLIDAVAHAGWQDRIRYFYIHGVYPWGNQSNTGMTPQEFAQFEIVILEYLHKKGFSVQFLPRRRTSGCTATRMDHEMVDVRGEVYSCNETSYVKPYYITDGRGKTYNIYSSGTLEDGDEVLDQRLRNDRLRGFLKGIRELPCGACPCLPVCGGGCPKQWVEGHVPCPPQRFNLGTRVLLDLATQRLGQRNVVERDTCV